MANHQSHDLDWDMDEYQMTDSANGAAYREGMKNGRRNGYIQGYDIGFAKLFVMGERLAYMSAKIRHLKDQPQNAQ